MTGSIVPLSLAFGIALSPVLAANAQPFNLKSYNRFCTPQVVAQQFRGNVVACNQRLVEAAKFLSNYNQYCTRQVVAQHFNNNLAECNQQLVRLNNMVQQGYRGRPQCQPEPARRYFNGNVVACELSFQKSDAELARAQADGRRLGAQVRANQPRSSNPLDMFTGDGYSKGYCLPYCNYIRIWEPRR